MTEEVCCPRFDPAPWEDKVHEWNGRRFIKGNVRSFLYMPLNFGSVMRSLDAKMTAAGAESMDRMSLSDHVSKWHNGLYLAVDKEVPGAENVVMSGKFYSKVYEGPFKDSGKWIDDFMSSVEKNGMEMEDMFSWYTTCPKCAKELGENYVVMFAKVI